MQQKSLNNRSTSSKHHSSFHIVKSFVPHCRAWCSISGVSLDILIFCCRIRRFVPYHQAFYSTSRSAPSGVPFDIFRRFVPNRTGVVQHHQEFVPYQQVSRPTPGSSFNIRRRFPHHQAWCSTSSDGLFHTIRRFLYPAFRSPPSSVLFRSSDVSFHIIRRFVACP